MLASDEKILLALVLSAAVILLFAIVVIIAIIKYRNKQREYEDREQSVAIELVKASAEAKDQTLEQIGERLHRDIQQTLALAKINVEKMIMTSQIVETSSLTVVKELLVKSISDIKDMSKELVGDPILEHTLEDSIRMQLERLQKRSHLETRFITSEEEIRIDGEKKLLLYRIVQEAINNVLSHAEATKLWVKLENHLDTFTLRIQDDGKGFSSMFTSADGTLTHMGLGLRSIERRTQLMNGTFYIQNLQKSGMSLVIQIPYNDKQH